MIFRRFYCIWFSKKKKKIEGKCKKFSVNISEAKMNKSPWMQKSCEFPNLGMLDEK